MRLEGRRVFLVMLGATLLLQTAWILALPAFRGSDEFDHVYKAASVAHGELRDQGPTESGHGSVITVPEDVVKAASDMCASYPYTGPDNCHPIERVGDGMVTVASGAGSYNPAYYAVVGWATHLFDGASSVFALRALTALLAALLLAWAAVVTAGWARNAWPMLTLLVSVTPVLVYSSAVASPNGITYAAGCLLWASGISLVEAVRPRYNALAVAGVALMTTHTTGLLWLAGIALGIGILQGRDRWLGQWREFRRPILRTALIIGGAGLATWSWILSAKTNSLPATENSTPLRAGDLITQQLSWVFQTIAAFPIRNEFAPVVVYVLWALPFLGLLGLGAKRADVRLRVALGLLLVMWSVVPLGLTLVSYSSIGFAWQGRYALPLAVGFMALAGLALHRRSLAPPPVVTEVIVVLCAIAQTISCVAVALKEMDTTLAPVFTATVPGGVAVVGLLAAIGALLPFVLVRRARRSELPTNGREPQPDQVMV